MSKITVYKVGNYQNLRDFFFKFRSLVHDKKIDWRRLSKSKVENIVSIISKSHWTLDDANFIYNVLVDFKAELKLFNVVVSNNIQPKENFVKTAEKQSKITRLESLSYVDGRFSLVINSTSDKLDAVRAFSERKFDPKRCAWIIGDSCAPELKVFCKNFNIQIGLSAEQALNNYNNNYELSYSAQRVDINVPFREGVVPYDYQTVGIACGINWKKIWITDQMGLGKTIQGIGIACGIGEYPILVLCPKSLRINWKTEIEKFTRKKAVIATQKNISKIDDLIKHGLADFIITNYDGVKSFFCESVEKTKTVDGKTRFKIELNNLKEKIKGVIIDESHELKNDKSERFKITKKVISDFKIRILMTGTPFVNHVSDIANQLDLLGVMDDFGGKHSFNKKYAKINKNNFSGDNRASSLFKELNIKLRSLCMIRREKHQVLTELPDKIRRVVKCELSNQKEYDHAFLNLQDYLVSIGASEKTISASERAKVLTEMQILKKLSAAGKVEQVSNEIRELIDNGEKAIIFVWHKATIDLYRKEFPEMVEISGYVTDQQIERNKYLFQEDPNVNVICITYKKGGVGHTLTAANHVFQAELGWNTKDSDQAEDRAHRIGQKNMVTAHYHLGAGTIDEYIYYDIIQAKRAMSVDALGSEEDIQVSEETLLIKKLAQTKINK